MTLDSFLEAYEEFIANLISIDPSFPESLEDEGWQDQNRVSIEELLTFQGVTLLDTPTDQNVLDIFVMEYSPEVVEDNGMLRRRQWREPQRNILKWEIDGFNFWNPFAVERQLQTIKKEHTPLEQVLKKDPDILTKAAKVFSYGWLVFLRENGYGSDYPVSDNTTFYEQGKFDELRERERVLVHRKLISKVKTAYALIAKRESEIAESRERFNAKYPDFEEVIKGLAKYPEQDLFDENGQIIGYKYEGVDINQLQLQWNGRLDQVVDERIAQEAATLYRKLGSIDFKSFEELNEQDSQLEQKAWYVGEVARRYLDPEVLNRVNIRNISNIADREGRKYDLKIIDTIQSLYIEIERRRQGKAPGEQPLILPGYLDRLFEQHKRTRLSG